MKPQGVDPPDHNVFRRLLAPMFTPTAVRGMVEELEKRAKALIGGFADKGECDFIQDFAARYPTGTFLYLFGLSEDRLQEFLDLAGTFFRSTDPAARAQNVVDIYAVLESLFREKERNPGNDIARYSELRLSALATTPAARRHFRDRLDDPDAFLRAIEELMRINAVSNLFRRVTHDCTFRGVALRKNDRVILPNTVANRDPAVFENPDMIDLDRKVNTHVTFGVGPHRGVGSHLAKREVMVSLAEWLRRIPDFELVPDSGETRAFGGSVMGFESLKLRWDV
ncbi:hypothetical protein E4T56_gene4813 [Termitomyces sp. T112]|nr:hypothetical protein E4T56_gene4813 [Termitomyces sp. T112]